MLKAPIAIGLSPNTQADDVWQAVKIFFQPWKWQNGDSLSKVEVWFKEYFQIDSVSFFNSGRSALLSILKSFDIGVGDEVLVGAFTCVAVPDPIIWAGACPVYIDIDETLNIDPKLIERHINKQTKAIIVQHTFGIPAKIKLIKEITQKRSLILIEDCAHSLGAKVNDKKVGTFGDAAFFSFGRDKVISSVFGGMAIINSKFKIQNSKLKKFQQDLAFPNYFWIFQQLLHPIALGLILPLYNIYVGKLLLFTLQKLNLLSKPIYKEEPIGGKPKIFPRRYPNALASLLSIQLFKLDSYNDRRREIANYYYSKLANRKDLRLPPKLNGPIYLRFNILTNKASRLLSFAKKNKIILGNWYRNIIDPKGVDYQKVGYKKESCLQAERMAKLSVNLPTYPRLSQSDVKKIVDLFKR